MSFRIELPRFQRSLRNVFSEWKGFCTRIKGRVKRVVSPSGKMSHESSVALGLRHAGYDFVAITSSLPRPPTDTEVRCNTRAIVDRFRNSEPRSSDKDKTCELALPYAAASR
ncbi:hypothetical protein TNCV_3605551 [Trichonephila clavipes]|uniref:Uncharacterized protein n=1 Tax=Trichonephila clavipes TaxID=2585209 RepID=A0A8X6RGZ9_TRICX|nr:hypothetical protein TNCV_3605551 [Trichonephila clavipes]